MVRLITHNLLACHAKGCTSNNFPLQFQDVSVELRDAEYNADFLRGFLPRLEWPALVGAARQVSPYRLRYVCIVLTDLVVDASVCGIGCSWGIPRFRQSSRKWSMTSSYRSCTTSYSKCVLFYSGFLFFVHVYL